MEVFCNNVVVQDISEFNFYDGERPVGGGGGGVGGGGGGGGVVVQDIFENY